MAEKILPDNHVFVYNGWRYTVVPGGGVSAEREPGRPTAAEAPPLVDALVHEVLELRVWKETARSFGNDLAKIASENDQIRKDAAPLLKEQAQKHRSELARLADLKLAGEREQFRLRLKLAKRNKKIADLRCRLFEMTVSRDSYARLAARTPVQEVNCEP